LIYFSIFREKHHLVRSRNVWFSWYTEEEIKKMAWSSIEMANWKRWVLPRV
jgi:hypothetical protein